MQVLQIIKCDLEKNGIVTFVNCVTEIISSDEIKFDVFVPGRCCSQSIAQKIENNGSRVIVNNIKKNAIFRFVAGIRLYSFLKKHSYDIVHINTGDPVLQATMVVASKFAKIDTIIVHSHGNIKPHGWIKKLLVLLGKQVVKRWADLFIACSEEAKESAFSPDVKDVLILQNGVLPENYVPDPKIKDAMREKYNVADCVIIGHVGSFIRVKNHEFLIDVFDMVKNRVSNAKLLLIGDGGERPAMEKRVRDKGLQNDVIFTGNVDNVSDFIQMMDVFVFPSIKEGTPFSCLEAQAMGVPCVLSTGVSQETIIDSSHVAMLSLALDKTVWADKIIENIQHPNRDAVSLINTKYDARKSMLILEEKYNECVRKRQQR